LLWADADRNIVKARQYPTDTVGLISRVQHDVHTRMANTKQLQHWSQDAIAGSNRAEQTYLTG